MSFFHNHQQNFPTLPQFPKQWKPCDRSA